MPPPPSLTQREESTKMSNKMTQTRRNTRLASLPGREGALLPSSLEREMLSLIMFYPDQRAFT
jgi:hypothetical protein